jgi:hypothetical protein
LFSSFVYDRKIVLLSLIVIVVMLIVFIKMGYGGRVFNFDSSKKDKESSGPMV